ncbi:MAG TPA: RDD family protein [Acidimicrobiales bacterium]|nr:RDD family protein [Acidimicrobiales bacterium]
MTAFGGALTDPTKIMGSRIGAYIVDLIIGTVVVVGVFLLFGASHFDEVPAGSPAAARQLCDGINDVSDGSSRSHVCIAWGDSARVASGDDLRAVQVQFWAASIGFGLLNYVVLSAIAGGTAGKLIFGLRVVTARGQRAGLGRNLVRWLLLVVDTACCFLPGLLTSFNSKGHRRVGDMVAGTYVVHRSAEGRLLHIPGHLHVKNRDPYAVPGAAPAVPAAAGSAGIDAPVFDPARNTYVRYDQASGTWFQWDDAQQAWVPAR